MSRIITPTPEQETLWASWAAGRPPAIKALCERFDPWSLYRLKTTGQRVTVQSFSEGDPPTMTVVVSGEFNRVLFDVAVFGINPDDLEPCDPPEPGDQLGAVWTTEQVDENTAVLRKKSNER